MNDKVIERHAKNTGSSDLIIHQSQIEQSAEHWHDYDKLKQVHERQSELDPILNMDTAYHAKIEQQRAEWPHVTQQPASKVLQIYDVVRKAGTYNAFGARVAVKSLLNLSEWDKASTGHPDDQWLLQLIRFGFPLQYMGPPNPSKGIVSPNHKSAIDYGKHITKFIQNEVDNQTIMGPFKQLPFEWANVAPMMTRPKSDPNKRRVIVDYSYPEGGINAMIDKNVLFGTEINHHLPTVLHAVEIVKGQQFRVKLSSIDLERAYRNFRTDPSDWPLTCIKHHDNFYVDTALPFGSRVSSLYMQRAANFVQRALAQKGIHILVYLDDALIITPEHHNADAQLREVITTVRALGLPVAYDKIQEPSKRCRFLGIIVDVQKKQLEIPYEKITAFLTMLTEVVNKKHITKTMLQSIIGSINHLSKAVQGARLFMNRFLECLRGVEGDRVEVNHEMTADIKWFLSFLRRYNGKTIVNDGHPKLFIEVDSCMIGGGGTDGVRAYTYKYPHAMTTSFNISQLEAINCLIAVRALVDGRYHNQLVSIACDNLGAICVFQNSRGRDRVLNAVARALWYFGAANNVEFRITHKPGQEMAIPNVLSRAYIDQASHDKANAIIHDNGFRVIKISPAMHDFNNYL